jgi:uncharacterized protein (DUF924 family)
MPIEAMEPLMSRITLAASALAVPLAIATGVPAAAQRAAIVSESTSASRTATELAPAEASAVVAFWREAGPSLWFAKDAGFDRRFRDRFLHLYEAASRGELDEWAGTAEGAMAIVILLDQYPRNSFRGTPRMYATDEMARRVAHAAIAAGHDHAVEPALRLFFYLPFAHSEAHADQERSVALVEALGEPSVSFAKRHRDIIRRFGRFPHRNPILGRTMTEEEQRYLDNGGFKG